MSNGADEMPVSPSSPEEEPSCLPLVENVDDTAEPENIREVLLVDEIARWMHLPRDLYLAALTIIAIGFVLLLAAYASATTLALTTDVRTATQDILETLLFIPINVVEGALSFFLPILIAADLMWHRQWRKLFASLCAALAAIASAHIFLWICEKSFPLAQITRQLSDSIAEQSFVLLIPYVAVIAALLTVTSTGHTWKATSWGWLLLLVAIVGSILKGNQTLPGALITILLGILCGTLARYIAGDIPERATGTHLIATIRRAGIDATSIVRLDAHGESPLYAWRTFTKLPLGYTDRFDLAQLRELLAEPGEESLDELFAPVEDSTPIIGKMTIDASVDPGRLCAQLREKFHPPLAADISRNYLVTAADGTHFHVSLLDTDRQILDALSSAWKRFILTTTTWRSQRSVDSAADRHVLMELVAANANLMPERSMRVARGHKSMLIAGEVTGEYSLENLANPEILTDENLDNLWAILGRAHARGISHGNITARSIVVREGIVGLIHWGKGALASSEMSRRIDLAQAIAALAAHLGIERALTSARRNLSTDQLLTLAPVLQKAIVPSSTLAQFADRKDMQHLREALAESVPQAREVSPVELRRFSPRTVVTLSIGVVAVYLLLASINMEDLILTIKGAQPVWMVASFLASMASFFGAAVVLQAYTAEKLMLREATTVQLAASVVALVAPAGIGPAALNLRYLHKKKVPTAVAVATVSLVQVAQFVTTILLLLVLSLITGDVGSFAVPSNAVLISLAIIALVLAVCFAVPQVRRWVLAKLRPIGEQIWPRLVWLGTHPIRLVYGFLGSLIQTAGYVTAFGFALGAFGYQLPIVTLTVTYLVSNSVGSIVPSPGGIGPVEAALTVGLTAAGVPYSIAFSTALLFRLLTFWIRIPLGWFALRRSQKKEII